MNTTLADTFQLTARRAPPALAALTGVEFHEVSKRYGSLFALRRVTLSVTHGEFVAVTGPNGSGKSTLLRVAALLTRPDAGRVNFLAGDGIEVAAPAEVKQRVGVVGHSSLLYDQLTARENLAFFARLHGVKQPLDRVEDLLVEVGLFERRDSLVRTFSRGMRQRLSIARALLHRPSLLLLDEPTTGLDSEAVEWLYAVLRSLHHGGCTIVMSTHAPGEAQELGTRAIRLEAGRLVDDVPGRRRA